MAQILGTVIQEAERTLARSVRKGEKSGVTGTKRLLRKFEKLERESRRKNNGNVNVGYGANYALHVHENIEMKWRGLPRSGEVRLGKGGKFVTTGHAAGKGKGVYWGPTGQAKFLEQPFRELQNSGELQRIVRQATKNGVSLMKSLIMAGMRVQRESQLLVPVVTGNLKGSAFTERE